MSKPETPPAPRTPAEEYDHQQPPAALPNEDYYRQRPAAEQRRRWGRLLLWAGGIWLAFALIGRFSVPSLGVDLFQQTESFSQTVDGERLLVNLVSDDVTVEPSDDGRIHVDATLRGYGWNNNAAHQALDRLELEVSSDGETARVTVHRPNGGFAFGFSRSPSVDLQLQVPPGTELRIETMSGEVRASNTSGSLAVSTASGDVTLSEHEGMLNLSTVSGEVQLADGSVTGLNANTTSGDLKLEGVAGPLKVTTISGEVVIEDASNAELDLQSTSGDISFSGALAASGSFAVNSVSGSVKLELPDDSAFTLDANTLSGELGSDFELAGEQSSRRLNGSVGSGGPTLRIETASGDIEIEGH
jgi:hypothetical protein